MASKVSPNYQGKLLLHVVPNMLYQLVFEEISRLRILHVFVNSQDLKYLHGCAKFQKL